MDARDARRIADLRQHGLSRDDFLPHDNMRLSAAGQVHVHPATEADQADALPSGQHIAGLDERHDTPSNKASTKLMYEDSWKTCVTAVRPWSGI